MSGVFRAAGLSIWLFAAMGAAQAAPPPALLAINVEADETVAEQAKLVPTDVIRLAMQQVSERLGAANAQPLRLQLLSPRAFRNRSSSPWATAMFSDGKILLPAGASAFSDRDEFERTIAHEYVHAVVAELSGYRCPAWLDEGLAQLLEGGDRPDLERTLEHWLQQHAPVPLSTLDKGFLSLPEAEAKVAYAESYYAARLLIAEHGFRGVREYIEALGSPQPQEFRNKFGVSLEQLEDRIKTSFRRTPSARDAKPAVVRSAACPPAAGCADARRASH